MSWRDIWNAKHSPPPVVPVVPPMKCPACHFDHFEAVNQTFAAKLIDGKPTLDPSGFKLMCSKCGSLLRLTADSGLKLVVRAKAEDEGSKNGEADEAPDRGDPDRNEWPDTDVRVRRWGRK